MNWRPDRWKNPYHKTEKALGTVVKFNEYPEFEIFEAGADAMLEALKKNRMYSLDEEKMVLSAVDILQKSGCGKGWLVFIPKEQ